MVIRMKHEELEQILNDIDLTKEAPAQEPQRQYYYMKRARQIVAQQEEVLGHRPTACAVTFGCQMNAKDSEKLIGILETIGYEMIEMSLQIWYFIIPVQYAIMQTSVYMADLVSLIP